MNTRIYFLLPDLESTRRVVDEMLQRGIGERHIHVIANHFTPLEALPAATTLQTSDLKYGVEMGIGVGGAAGLIGGLLAVTFPPAGLVLGGAALLAGTLAGAGLGGLISALIARDMPNHRLRVFEKAIAAGELLILVDLPKRQVDATTEFIRETHPEAEIGLTHRPAGNHSH